MDLEKKSPFYQSSENLNVGSRIGHCSLDGDQPTCDGDIHSCEARDLLKGYSLVQKRRKEWERKEWEKKRNAHSSGSQKF